MHVTDRIIFRRLRGSRVVAKPEAVEALVGRLAYAPESLVMRFAPDEVFVVPVLQNGEAVSAIDEHAIIINEGAFSGAWLSEEEALTLLEMHAEWEMPQERPAFAQGMVAGVATKLCFVDDVVVFVVPSPYADELEERLS